MEQVFIHKIGITKKGQQYFFQLNLPKTTHQIIGIETNVRVLSFVKKRKHKRVLPLRFGVKRNTVVGTLQLKAMETNQPFYATTIITNDSSIGIDDLVTKKIAKEFPPKLIPDKADKNEFIKVWASSVFTHGTQQEEDAIQVCGVNTVYGTFTDVWGKQQQKDIEYTVQLYVWTTEKVKE